MTASLIVKYLGVPFSPVFPSQPSKSLPLKRCTGFSLAGNLTVEDQSSALDQEPTKDDEPRKAASASTAQVDRCVMDGPLFVGIEKLSCGRDYMPLGRSGQYLVLHPQYIDDGLAVPFSHAQGH